MRYINAIYHLYHTLRETAYCDGDNAMQLNKEPSQIELHDSVELCTLTAELHMQSIKADTLLYINYYYVFALKKKLHF